MFEFVEVVDSFWSKTLSNQLGYRSKRKILIHSIYFKVPSGTSLSRDLYNTVKIYRKQGTIICLSVGKISIEVCNLIITGGQ